MKVQFKVHQLPPEFYPPLESPPPPPPPPPPVPPAPEPAFACFRYVMSSLTNT